MNCFKLLFPCRHFSLAESSSTHNFWLDGYIVLLLLSYFGGFFQTKSPVGDSNCDNVRFMESGVGGCTIDLLTSKTNSEIESESESNDYLCNPTEAQEINITKWTIFKRMYLKKCDVPTPVTRWKFRILDKHCVSEAKATNSELYRCLVLSVPDFRQPPCRIESSANFR